MAVKCHDNVALLYGTINHINVLICHSRRHIAEQLRGVLIDPVFS